MLFPPAFAYRTSPSIDQGLAIQRTFLWHWSAFQIETQGPAIVKGGVKRLKGGVRLKMGGMWMRLVFSSLSYGMVCRKIEAWPLLLKFHPSSANSPPNWLNHIPCAAARFPSA